MTQDHTVYCSDSVCLLPGGPKQEDPPTEEGHLNANLGLMDAQIYILDI